MSFDKKSFYDIYSAMEAETRERAPELSDFQEGSIVRSMFEAFSVEMGILYEQMDHVYKSAFIDTSDNSNLERVVSVLGVKRNEPDYATGEVTFQRDKGWTEKITIPAGTVITTKENKEEEIQKKAYLTIEEGVIDSHETSVDVRVRAELRGKDMITGTGTVVVMPRPIAGIKSVINDNPMRFIGKDGENDDELRSRAKQTVLASGRASITSIENALFSFPGIREVKVNEVFEIYKLNENSFENLESEIPAAIVNKLKVLNEVEFISLKEFENTLIELIEKENFETYRSIIIKNARFFNPGIIEVYVDGLTDENYNQIKERIDQVRAAGIYVLIKPAVEEKMEACFKVELDSQVATEEREKLEDAIRDEIITFVDSLGLGDPLLFSQLTTRVLNIKGVSDLSDFRITTHREIETFAEGEIILSRDSAATALSIETPQIFYTALGDKFQLTEPVIFDSGEMEKTVKVRSVKEGEEGELYRVGDAIVWNNLLVDETIFHIRNTSPIVLTRETFLPDSKRISIELLSRFSPQDIIVASETKKRMVNLHIKLNNPVEDITEMEEQLIAYFEELEVAEHLDENIIKEELTLTLDDSVKLFQLPHQKERYEEVFVVNPGIVEKAEQNIIFIYNDDIELKGEIKLILSLTSTGEEKNIAKATVKQILKDYLDTLKPEEDVEFEKLKELAKGCEGVLRVELDPSLFSIWKKKSEAEISLENEKNQAAEIALNEATTAVETITVEIAAKENQKKTAAKSASDKSKNADTLALAIANNLKDNPEADVTSDNAQKDAYIIESQMASKEASDLAKEIADKQKEKEEAEAAVRDAVEQIVPVNSEKIIEDSVDDEKITINKGEKLFLHKEEFIIKV